MKICSKCGVEQSEDARYCKACGTGQGGQEDAGLRQEKRARVFSPGRRLPWSAWITTAAAALLVALWAVSLAMRDGSFSLRSPARMSAAGKEYTGIWRPVTATGGAVKIPTADLADGKAHFYSYESRAGTVRFFAIRRTDGSVGLVLDACNSCYRARLGYRQDGDHVVCNNCGMSFRPDDVGIVTGGCNPIPLTHTFAAGAVIVKTADLVYGGKYF